MRHIKSFLALLLSVVLFCSNLAEISATMKSNKTSEVNYSLQNSEEDPENTYNNNQVADNNLGKVTDQIDSLYKGKDFSAAQDQEFGTTTLIVQTDNPNFDTLSADKVIAVSKNLYAVSFSDSTKAKSAFDKYQGMNGVDFVEPDLVVSTDTESVKSTESTTELATEVPESKKETESATKTPESTEAVTETEVPTTETATETEAVPEQSATETESEQDVKAPIKVAIIDTGIDSNAALTPYIYKIDENVTDQNGHGTEIAGLIVDYLSKNGLSTDQVKIIPEKVAGDDGKCTILQLYLGIEKALSAGANILNISMGTKDTAGSNLLGQAVDDAYEKGVIFVTSAGNNKDDVSLYAPANMDKAITVGSVNKKKEQSNFSNHGKTIDCVSYGENIAVTGLGGKKETVNGTSFSAVLVTEDLLKQMVVGSILTPDDATAYIKSNAEDLGTAGWDEDYGYGLIGSYTYPTEEPETEKETEAETQNSSEVTTVDDTTQPVTNYADSGNLTEEQQQEMSACLSYGDILNDINTVASTQNVYAATGLISFAKTKAAQLQESIKSGYITDRYFTGQGYVSPVVYQSIGNDAVDTAGKTLEESLHTYAKSGSDQDLTAFYGKLDEFYNILNANKRLTVQADSMELTDLASTAATNASNQINEKSEDKVTVQSCEVSFSDTDAVNQWQNLESENLYKSINANSTAQLKQFITSLSDNDQQLLAARLGQHYQDIMARVYDAEVQTESADQATYYVADEASNRLYAESNSSNAVTVNSTMTSQKVTSILLTSSVTVNNYMVVSSGTDVAIDSTSSANGYKLGSNFDYTTAAGKDSSTFDGKNYYQNYTFSMIYVASGSTLSIQGKAFLDGKNRPHNGFLIFMQNNSKLKLKDSAVLRNNKMVTYSGQKNGGYGSAVCVSKGSVFHMTGGSIINNKNCDRDTGILTQGGAAIGNQGGTVNISGGIIKNNTSALGAIWNCAGTLNISGGTIIGNTSDTNMGGNIHLSKDGAAASTATISGGTICDSAAGNGIFISNGCTCNITDKDVFIYGNNEAGISNGGTLNITAGVKIGFSSYTSVSDFNANENKNCGILNTGSLYINAAARIYGGNGSALVNYGTCNAQSGAGAMLLCTTADSVVVNVGKLFAAGHNDAGEESLLIYSSTSNYGITNNGTMRFGGNIDGRYNVTATGRQSASDLQHSFSNCLYSKGTGSYDAAHPYAVQVFGDAILRNGTTGIKVAAGTCLMSDGFVTGNTNDGIAVSSGANVVVEGGSIYSNNGDGIQNAGTLTVTGNNPGAQIYSNAANGINNGDTAKLLLYCGTIYGNGKYGVTNNGNANLSGQSTPASLQIVGMGYSSCNSYTDYAAAPNASGNIFNGTSATLQLGGCNTSLAYARMVSNARNNITNKGTITCPGNSSWNQTIVLWGAGIGISNSGTATMGNGVAISNFTSSENRVGVKNTGTFTINGGTISNGTTGISNTGTVNMTGGIIANNATHGVYQNGIFNMSGSATVNTNNDVCLAYGKVITVNGALTTNNVVAKITPVDKFGDALPRISGITKNDYISGGLGVSVVKTSYANGKGSNALFYNTSGTRFILSNKGILRPGDYMDKNVLADERSKGNINKDVFDTDIAISTSYNVTYNKNIDEKDTSGNQMDVDVKDFPTNQTKYWCEDLLLPNSTKTYTAPSVTTLPFANTYKFDSWNTASDGKSDVYAMVYNYIENKDLSLYAIWQKNIKVAYIGNGQTTGANFVDAGTTGNGIPLDSTYTFNANASAEGAKEFEKESSYTNDSTGEQVPITATITKWSLRKESQNKENVLTYDKGQKQETKILYNTALSIDAVSIGTPSSDFYEKPNTNLKSFETKLFQSVPIETDKLGSMFLQESLLKGASPADSTPYINLYAVWDEGPKVQAHDLYYTLSDAQNTSKSAGTGITSEELLKNIDVKDKEDANIRLVGFIPSASDKVSNTTYATISNYSESDFTGLQHEGSVTENVRAEDSAGNVTNIKFTIHIVDTTSTDTKTSTGLVRFIDDKNYPSTLSSTSIWRTDSDYITELGNVLQNKRINQEKTKVNPTMGDRYQVIIPGSGHWKVPPVQTWEFTHDQVTSVKNYVDLHGIGKLQESNALSMFLSEFATCRK